MSASGSERPFRQPALRSTIGTLSSRNFMPGYGCFWIRARSGPDLEYTGRASPVRRGNMRTLRLGFIVVICLVATPGAQDSSTLVRLDIHATQDGRPVPDLSASDIELIEDGVPQKIETFQH